MIEQMKNSNWRIYLLFGIGFTVALSITFFGTANQIGPRIMWASDLCPRKNVVCGSMALWPVVGALIGAVVTVVSSSLLQRQHKGEKV